MVYDIIIEKALFNEPVTQYDLCCQILEGNSVDTLAQVLFLRQSLPGISGLPGVKLNIDGIKRDGT
jgi:hypothetical protein